VEIAALLIVKERTVRYNIKQWRDKSQGGNHRKDTLTCQEHDAISRVQNEHHQWSYKRVAAAAAAETGMEQQSREAVRMSLKADKFTTKRLTNEQIAKNTDESAKRLEYVTHAEKNLTAENTIYFDESGFDETMHRIDGRSPKHEPAVIETRVTRSQYLRILAAMSPALGILKYELWNRSVDGDEYTDFAKQVAKMWKAKHEKNAEDDIDFIFDNASIHKKEPLTEMLEKISPYYHATALLLATQPDRANMERMEGTSEGSRTHEHGSTSGMHQRNLPQDQISPHSQLFRPYGPR
jgi:transposase